MGKIKSKWDKLDDKAKKWASRLTTIATIIGVLVAAGTWLVTQLDSAVAARIEDQTSTLREEVKEIEKEREATARQTDLQLTRLELMMLMETDPDNVIEIEKVAHRYFIELGGNTYMSSEFSRWCKMHNANCEIVLK